MTVGLAVETTTIHYGVAVFAGREVIAHRTVRRDDPAFDSIGALAASVLAGAGHAFADLGLLAVNVGPGNLTSVRAGVAYANGLAFALGCQVIGVDALTLLAREVSERLDEPVLCLRNAGGGNVYAGLFTSDTQPVFAHGPIGTVVPRLAGGPRSLSAAGVFRAEVGRLLRETAVKDTGVEVSGVLTLHELVTDPATPAGEPVPAVSPVTDSSAVFGG